MKMKKFNTQAKREITIEGLSTHFIEEWINLTSEYYKQGKVVSASEYYIFVSDEGKNPNYETFTLNNYKKFLDKALKSVHLTKKKRNVFIGINFSYSEDGIHYSDGARDLVGFSSSY